MAGIGFELKKLFVGRGVVRKLRAYAYAGIICSGTMILAIALLLCLQEDMAKALGQALASRLPPQTPILCLDRVSASAGSYLDIGAPVSNALPVVVKTLVLADNLTRNGKGTEQ